VTTPLVALSISLSIVASCLASSRVAAQASPSWQRDSVFAKQYGTWAAAKLGDSSDVAILDSAGRVAVYTAALDIARHAYFYPPEHGRAWLLADFLASDQPPQQRVNFDTLTALDVGVLHAVVVRTDMGGFCRGTLPQCPAIRSGETSYAVSRIYRIDSNAVRTFVVTQAPPGNWRIAGARILVEQSREDVFRVELRNGTWTVTAHSPVWIED